MVKEAKASQEALKPSKSEHNFTFWFHVLITVLAWVGPFLFSWQLMVTAYLIVLLQFLIFKRCLLNSKHALDDGGDTTFYSYLFEQLGYHPNKRVLKLWVRRYFYVILSAVSIIWQVLLGFEPLLFFKNW